MTEQDIQNIIFDALEMVNHSRDDDDKVPITPETLLFGDDGHLDSMGLVSLLIDVEESLLAKDFKISLSDERAMSEKNSPFKSIPSLTRYIAKLMEEK
jgi:acyl carrier protein